MVSLAMNDASTFVFALNHNSESNKKCAQIIGGSEILLSTGGKKGREMQRLLEINFDLGIYASWSKSRLAQSADGSVSPE